MQLNAILMEIASHPVIRAAAVHLAVELADGSLSKTIDKTLDRAAYSVAKRIVEEKNQIKEKSYEPQL